MNKIASFTAAIILLTTGAALASNGNAYLAPSPDAPGWARIDPSTWSPGKAATAAELVSALLKAPLESLEGNPDVKVHVWKNGDSFRAAVKTTNLPDDAVRTEETVIAIKKIRSGWTVTEVWKRWVCRRGTNAGKWTTKLCP